MDKQEKIVCAAIKFAIQKEDYKGEKVVAGVDYKSIVDDGALRYLAHPEATNIWKLGFLTNTNRFVESKEAEVIAGLAGQIWVDSGRHNLSSIQFEKSLKKMWGDGKVTMSIKFPSSTGHYFIHHTIGMGLKPEDLY